MNGKTPYTPLSTRLSGSARETEIRLRNIFSGPKERPPALFLALVFAVCVLCGNLVSCQNAEAKNPDSSNVSRPDPVLTLTVSEMSPDLNQNGIPEEISLENACQRQPEIVDFRRNKMSFFGGRHSSVYGPFPQLHLPA